MSTTTSQSNTPTSDSASPTLSTAAGSQAGLTTTERTSRFRQLTAPKKRVIRDWDPEDTQAWEAGNQAIAKRNLVWSVATEHVGFSIWSIWSSISRR